MEERNNLPMPDREPDVPLEVRTWNWAAFFLTFIWGIPHRIYLSLLVLIPVVGLVIPILLGFKGNEWAWQRRSWKSVEEFQVTQRRWAHAAIGVCILLVVVLFILGLLSLVIGNSLPVVSSDEIQLENPSLQLLSCLEENEAAVEIHEVDRNPPVLIVDGESEAILDGCLTEE